MDEYDGFVFDLDGTLVRLTVDWEAVASDVRTALLDRGITPPERLWDMLKTAEAHEERDVVESIIESHEQEGARQSERLPAADALPNRPISVCSLNAESACRIALAEHDLDHQVISVVGRDTVATEKPDPKPLLTAIEALGVHPSNTVFIGDGTRDEKTAERAGVPFLYVSRFVRAYQ